MVVDDDADIRASIADVLLVDGYRGIAVENGGIPRAVVTALVMPMRTGYSLIEHTRSDDRTRVASICVVSAASSAAREGTVAIRKPFELAELREALRHAIRRDACAAR